MYSVSVCLDLCINSLEHRSSNVSLSFHRKLLDAAKDRLELVLKRDPLSSGVKKLSLAKLTNGYAATSASHKEELLGGYTKSNLYNGVKTGGYAEPPSRQPLPMEEGGCAGCVKSVF